MNNYAQSMKYNIRIKRYGDETVPVNSHSDLQAFFSLAGNFLERITQKAPARHTEE